MFRIDFGHQLGHAHFALFHNGIQHLAHHPHPLVIVGVVVFITVLIRLNNTAPPHTHTSAQLVPAHPATQPLPTHASTSSSKCNSPMVCWMDRDRACAFAISRRRIGLSCGANPCFLPSRMTSSIALTARRRPCDTASSAEWACEPSFGSTRAAAFATWQDEHAAA